MNKKRVLIVHSQLAQHGSEKLMYELAKLLVQQGLSVDVLVRPFRVRNQYYYPLLREIGIEVIQRLVTFRHVTFLFKSIRSSRGVAANLVRQIYAKFAELIYFRKARKYDRIVVIGMETYCDSFAFMLGDKSAIHVHHVMHRFQQERDYSIEYDLDRIIVVDDRQSSEIRESLPNIELFKFPLPFDLKNTSHNRTHHNFKLAFIQRKPIRIGVVSRVKLDRPNEPIFQHFAALKAVMPAELHIFGSGDPKIYYELLSDLNIEPFKVIFHGHAECIASSFDQIGIDIAWSVSMMGSISYAAIELITIGVPVFFINIGDKQAKNNGHAIHCAESETETIEFHQSLFENPDLLDGLVARERAHVHMTFDAVRLQNELKSMYGL
jgi:hypothetical protein